MKSLLKLMAVISISACAWISTFTHAESSSSVSSAPDTSYQSDAAAQLDNPQSIKDQLKDYLFSAARAGDTEMLQEFINAGYDLNTQDSKGYTALILSAYNGHGKAAEQLINAGADVCAQDNRGNTAMMGAIFKGELRIARLLMKSDCSVDTANNAGQTPAMYAALFQRTEVLSELRSKGADINKQDQFGNTAASLEKGEISTTIAQ